AVIADKGYDSDAFLERLKARDIKEIRDCDFALYCEHNLVERFFNKIKHYRAIATRLRQARQHVSRWRPARLRGPMAQLTTRPSVLIEIFHGGTGKTGPNQRVLYGLSFRALRIVHLDYHAAAVVSQRYSNKLNWLGDIGSSEVCGRCESS